jgi:hypothetical protein
MAKSPKKAAPAAPAKKTRSKKAAAPAAPAKKTRSKKAAAPAAPAESKGRSYYVKNRPSILAKSRAKYKASPEATRLRVAKWRAKNTKKVVGKRGKKIKMVVPMYMSGKKGGRKPVNARLPRLHGPNKGKKTATVGKKPATTIKTKLAVMDKQSKASAKKAAPAKSKSKAKAAPTKSKSKAKAAPAKKAGKAKKKPMS